MDAIEVIEHARRIYVDQLARFMEEAAKQLPDGWGEMQTSRGEASALFRGLYRVDYLGREGGELSVAELAPDKYLQLNQAIEGSFGSLLVRIEQVEWDDVAISHDSAEDLTAVLTPWFEQWSDLGDTRQLTEETKLLGVIHVLQLQRGYVEVDFGSAPLDALWELLMLLGDAGASKVTISRTRERD